MNKDMAMATARDMARPRTMVTGLWLQLHLLLENKERHPRYALT